MPDSQKNFHKKLLGKVGEKLAVKHLKSLGYKILDKNYTTPFGEIDVICLDGDTVVFCEVKTRTSDVFGTPGEAVDRDKRRKYVMTAQNYLVKKYKKLDVKCRFDVVEIENGQINHVINAFFA